MITTTTTKNTTTSDQVIDLNEYKDKDNVINLIDPQPTSLLLLPNSTIFIVFTQILFVEQSMCIYNLFVYLIQPVITLYIVNIDNVIDQSLR
jgi:hypothetical protein